MIRADQVLDELRPGLAPEVLAQIPPLSERIARANCLCLYGVGREGLMMKALAMRLYHLGLAAHVVGDMTTPALGVGDALLISAGPGEFSTVEALAGVAKDAGAEVICFTAEPFGTVPLAADLAVTLPAQTMAADQGGAGDVDPAHGLAL